MPKINIQIHYTFLNLLQRSELQKSNRSKTERVGGKRKKIGGIRSTTAETQRADGSAREVVAKGKID